VTIRRVKSNSRRMRVPNIPPQGARSGQSKGRDSCREGDMAHRRAPGPSPEPPSGQSEATTALGAGGFQVARLRARQGGGSNGRVNVHHHRARGP
jgi:hypothetical protein